MKSIDQKVSDYKNSDQYKIDLQNWDGWGTSPSDSFRLSLINAEQRKAEIEERKNCRTWIAYYHNIQKHTKLSCIVKGTEEEALTAAKFIYGNGDGFNKFVGIRTTK